MRRRLAVLFVAGLVLVLAIMLLCVWRGVSHSLKAEGTLHAYNLVLDVVAEYIEQNGEWPDSWNALATTSTALNHSVWNWPRDIDQIRKRVRIDLSLRIQDVADMHEDAFTAVGQIGPHYEGNESAIRELIATAKRVSN